MTTRQDYDLPEEIPAKNYEIVSIHTEKPLNISICQHQELAAVIQDLQNRGFIVIRVYPRDEMQVIDFVKEAAKCLNNLFWYGNSEGLKFDIDTIFKDWVDITGYEFKQIQEWSRG